jgi:predicted phage terminase large subunit-like protein
MRPLHAIEAEIAALEEEVADDLERELCRSLSAFARRAWHVVEPGQPYTHGRHIDVMCAHLEAVTRGEITRLLINVPPGTMKSLLVNVFWPMWEWGPLGLPHIRSVGVSHEQGLGVRDNLKCRRLLLSDWYQRLWPEVRLQRDQSEKIKFENTRTGFREVATPSNITGRRGDRVVVDDPLSAENANSEAERERVNLWFREALPTRLNNPDRSAIVVVMQRLHERDVAGIILDMGGWESLILPMRFEPDRADPDDWRTDEDELLFPERFPAPVVAELERSMGTYAAAGQLQQRPAPREGGLFKRHWFSFLGAIPAGNRRQVRAWDLAATKKATSNNPDWTAGLLMSRGSDGVFLIEGVERLRGSPMEVKATVKSRAATDPRGTVIRLPQDPGQAGKDQAETFVRDLAGYSVKVERVTGDKATRATPAAAQAEAGNVKILLTGDAERDAWIEPFLDEVCMFPGAAHDDQVDALSDALNELALGSSYNIMTALT